MPVSKSSSHCNRDIGVRSPFGEEGRSLPVPQPNTTPEIYVAGRFDAASARRAGKPATSAILIASRAFLGNVGQANYSASKAGVIGLTKTIAREFAQRGINVNAIAPGYIETPMTEALPEKVKEELKRLIPMERLGKPEDVAEAVLFLVSEESNYITGQVLNVNGGIYM